MARSAASRSAAPARRGGGRWLQGLACGAVLTLAAPSALLFAILALPTLLVWIIDRDPDKATARNVLLFAAAMALPSLAALWQAGRGWEASLDLLTQVNRLAAAWAVQAGAWLLSELAPVLIRLSLDLSANNQAARLRARRASLEADWGLPPPADPDTD